jgi:hypothetical protein
MAEKRAVAEDNCGRLIDKIDSAQPLPTAIVNFSPPTFWPRATDGAGDSVNTRDPLLYLSNHV